MTAFHWFLVENGSVVEAGSLVPPCPTFFSCHNFFHLNSRARTFISHTDLQVSLALGYTPLLIALFPTAMHTWKFSHNNSLHTFPQGNLGSSRSFHFPHLHQQRKRQYIRRRNVSSRERSLYQGLFVSPAASCCLLLLSAIVFPLGQAL